MSDVKRLLYRAERRGTLEMDWLMGGFTRWWLGREGEKEPLSVVLEGSDVEIMAWIRGEEKVPEGVEGVIEGLRWFYERGGKV